MTPSLLLALVPDVSRFAGSICPRHLRFGSFSTASSLRGVSFHPLCACCSEFRRVRLVFGMLDQIDKIRGRETPHPQNDLPARRMATSHVSSGTQSLMRNSRQDRYHLPTERRPPESKVKKDKRLWFLGRFCMYLDIPPLLFLYPQPPADTIYGPFLSSGIINILEKGGLSKIKRRKSRAQNKI